MRENHTPLEFFGVRVEECWGYPALMFLSLSAAYTLPMLGWLRSLSPEPKAAPLHLPPVPTRQLGLKLLPKKNPGPASPLPHPGEMCAE